MAEKLTKSLIESELMRCMELHHAVQRDGETRWAWSLNELATSWKDHNEPASEREFSFEFASHDAALNFALKWVRENRPDLVQDAKEEAIAGIKYRASKHGSAA